MAVLWDAPIYNYSFNTLKEPSRFHDFLYKRFYNYECYKDMKPNNKQPACLYETDETHKIENLEDITVANLKFWPIISETGNFT